MKKTQLKDLFSLIQEREQPINANTSFGVEAICSRGVMTKILVSKEYSRRGIHEILCDLRYKYHREEKSIIKNMSETDYIFQHLPKEIQIYGTDLVFYAS